MSTTPSSGAIQGPNLLLVLVFLTALTIVAYAPVLSQPLLEDDYPNIAISLDLGVPGNWRHMAGSVFRSRATSLWLMAAAYRNFHLHPAPYYCLSILLHVLNTWLIFSLGCWRALGYRVSAWTAAVFAVSENHQEAIMWFSACNELLQFLFGIAAFVCWLNFLSRGTKRVLWHLMALFCFILALISKESAVIFAALFLLPVFDEQKNRRSAIWFVLPFVALGAASAWSIYAGKATSFRFEDGSFSLHAPVWRIWPINLARLFWFWGLLGLLLTVAFEWRPRLNTIIRGLLWAAIGLLPYSFLLYWTRIPSRQFYLPSLGVALITAAGFLAPRRRLVTAVLCSVFMVQNVGYIWTKKRHQYLERAQPTEALIALARTTSLPIYVQCFPQNHLVAEEAVHLGAGRLDPDLIWDQKSARQRGQFVTFCYARR